MLVCIGPSKIDALMDEAWNTLSKHLLSDSYSEQCEAGRGDASDTQGRPGKPQQGWWTLDSHQWEGL